MSRFPRVHFERLGIGFWLVEALAAALAVVCLVGAVRMVVDPAYADHIRAGGDSLWVQIVLSIVGFLFFGGAAALGLAARWVLKRSARAERTPDPEA